MEIFVLQVIFLIIFNISFGQSHEFVPQHVVDSYFTAEEICLRQYSSRIDSIKQEVKADSLSCLRAADIRYQSNEKFEILQEPMKKCSSPQSGIKDYFKCIENIVPEIQIKLREITSAYQVFLQNIEKIDQKKTACLKKASINGNDESTNAAFNLNMCLKSIRQPQLNSTNEQIENDFLSNLDVIKEKYNELQLDAQTYAEKQNMDAYLIDGLKSNSSEYFSKITEIDEVDDSCLRQYIVKNLNENFKFDLQSCLVHGSIMTLESEENFENDNKLIGDLIYVYKELTKCRTITEDLDIHDCFHEKFQSIWTVGNVQEAISRKSETNFKNFKETLVSAYIDQYPCIENLYDFLQFYGFNIGPMEKNVLFSCFEKGYKPTTLPIEEQLIKDLGEIK